MIIGPGIKHNKKITILSNIFLILLFFFLKLEIACPTNVPDIKQHKMDSRKLDMLNETNRHAIVNKKKVNLFKKSVRFTFFLPFL